MIIEYNSLEDLGIDPKEEMSAFILKRFVGMFLRSFAKWFKENHNDFYKEVEHPLCTDIIDEELLNEICFEYVTTRLMSEFEYSYSPKAYHRVARYFAGTFLYGKRYFNDRELNEDDS